MSTSDRRAIVDLPEEEARHRLPLKWGTSYAGEATGQVRLNIATSPERLTEIVERLAEAWT